MKGGGPVGAIALERCFHGVADGLADVGGRAEPDLPLGGVNIDVHGCRIHFDEEKAHRILSLHERRVVALPESLGEAEVFDGTSVEEAELLLAGGTTDAGAPEVATDANPVFLRGRDGEKILGEGGTVEIADAVEEGGGRGELEGDAFVLDVDEADLGVGQGEELELMFDVARFGRLCAEEFTASWQVVKKRAHLDLSARGVAAVADRFDAAAVHEDFGASQGMVFAGGEPEVGDGGDAREGFAAEAEGVDGCEIVPCSDFTGGVAFEAKEGVVAIHADAVVGDLDEGNTAPAGQDFDASGGGVDRIFNEFFDDGGRSFDDLAGGHLAGDLFGEQVNTGHEER